MFSIGFFIRLIFFKLTVLFIPPLLVLQAVKIASIKYCQFSFSIISRPKSSSVIMLWRTGFIG